MSNRRVVITGIGVISPIGNNLAEFWDSVREGRGGAGPITRFDASAFKTHFAMEVKGFEFREVCADRRLRNLDPYAQYAVASSLEASAAAGVEIGPDEHPSRFGVITGSGIGGLQTIEENTHTLIERGPSRISPFLVPMMMLNAAGGHIAILHGFQGPNFSTASACASAQHALGVAFRTIKRGGSDVILAGGSDAAITPLGIGGFNSLKALSTRNDDPGTASRPFSKSRDGFVMGEGGAMFVFEAEERARARGAEIYAEVLGFGMTDDAYHITAPLPEGTHAASAMREATSEAGLNPDEIDYINAHGTSTALNDAMETRAIRSVFGDHASKLMVSSTKSQVGHLLGGSGAVELAAVAQGIHTGVVPPTINYQDPDPECDLDYVPNQAREAPIRNALSNSFGFGGHNACLCLGRYEG